MPVVGHGHPPPLLNALFPTCGGSSGGAAPFARSLGICLFSDYLKSGEFRPPGSCSEGLGFPGQLLIRAWGLVHPLLARERRRKGRRGEGAP